MKFGYFDDKNKEYVITTPQTPYPWINYLGNNEFFSLISNTAGGYCFYKDAKLRRILRYRYNNMPMDTNGRYFYIKDEEDYWTPGWMPVKKELDAYECLHGLGYTKIKSSRNNVKADITYFVPLHFNGEVHRVQLTNESSSSKELTIFSYLEFCLWDAQDDMTNFQRNLSTGEVEVEESTIYHKTEYRERRNHYAFYGVNHPCDGFDTDRESFVGLYNGLEAPNVVKEGASTNSMSHGWSPIASHQVNVVLQPKETKELIFVLGYVENHKEDKWASKGIISKIKAKRMMKQMGTSDDVNQALVDLENYWDDLLSNFQITSHDAKLDRMVNIWNQYQCMVTFNMSRSASYFESGIGRGMGFRDSNQDILGFVHQIPERARERILDIASTQFKDGSAYHQYQPLTKQGNNDIGGGFNDDPLWLILAVSAYIKETGDRQILEEQVPYDCNPQDVGSLYNHIKSSFYHVINNLGPHGLPLIGRADWNDCLNLNCFSKEPGESFQTYGDPDGRVAESIFIAGMFVYIGKEFVKICRMMGKKEEAIKGKEHINKMYDTIMDKGYDGNWFIRAYDAFGEKIGSHSNKEGQIYIEPQGFCVMAGIGVKEGLAKKALDAVKEKLDSQYGIVLHQPAYTTYHDNIGEISSYPPGYKENAGIFCHNNPWIACAETVLNRGNRAFEIYRKITPAYLEDISEIHKTEPYVYSQMIAGKDAPTHGEAKNSWLTGTAAWNFITITQWILGIKPDFNGLTIDPCIPKEWDGYKVIRKYRNNTYNIAIENPQHVSKGVKEVCVDGHIIVGNTLPASSTGHTYQVKVIMGY